MRLFRKEPLTDANSSISIQRYLIRLLFAKTNLICTLLRQNFHFWVADTQLTGWIAHFRTR